MSYEQRLEIEFLIKKIPSKKMMTIENLIEKNKIIIGKKIKNKINMKKYHYYIKAKVVFFLSMLVYLFVSVHLD